MTTSPISEAKVDLSRLTKIGMLCALAVSTTILGVEFAFFDTFIGISAGYLIGAVLSLANLHLLSRALMPFVFYGEKPMRVLSGVLLSLAGFIVVALLLNSWSAQSLWGFAFGIASPAFYGVMYALRVIRAQ